MSKAKGKGKQKKGEQSDAQVDLIEEQKRQLLEQTFTIKKLQERLSRMTQENNQIATTKDKFHQGYEEKIDRQRIIIETHQSTIKDHRGKIYELEVNKMTLQNKIKDLDREMRQMENIKNRQLDQYRRVTQNQITKLELQLKEYHIYMSERQEKTEQNSTLKKTLEEEKHDRIRDVADKQRQKIQAIDKLRDQMLTKIRDMRTNLLSLKKQQLSTTTRLAVLQNHQLTSQLEFQSKQSQKLIFQNQNLQKKVSNLQKDLQIHKQIEDELAKRSHYARGIIKKLGLKITDLEEQLKEVNNKLNESSSKQTEDHLEGDKRSEMLRLLDKNLESTQKKYIKLQSTHESVIHENSQLKSNIDAYQRQSNELITALLRYFHEIIEGKVEVNDKHYQYDLKNIRNKAVAEWSIEEVRLVVANLLERVGQLINRKNLGISYLHKQDGSVFDSDQVISNVKLPKISEHSIVSKLQMSMKMKEMPVHLASKLVGSNIREWGRTVHSNSMSTLARKFKVHN